MAARSLQTQQQALEVTAHNLANASNPAYARQRVIIQTGLTVPTAIGLQGTGAEAVAIQQIRSVLLDGQMTAELSVSGYWNAQQQALQYAQAGLGQQIDRISGDGSDGQQGIAGNLSALFNSFQSLSTNPTSMAERQVLLQNAQTLASHLNQVAGRLDALRSALDQSLQDDVAAANDLLREIASFNEQIVSAELNSGSAANELRDLRQQKIEELSRLVKIDTVAQTNGAIDVSVGGVTMVSNDDVVDSLEVYDAGGGQRLVRAATAGAPLALTGGSVAGLIDVRDGAIATLADDLDSLAVTLVTAVNAVHGGGFSLTGSTGASFFTGTDARTIAVNTVLIENPALIQASGASGVVGDNQVAVQLAQLAGTTHAALNNQSFGQAYASNVAALGQSLASVNNQITDQELVEGMIRQQRDAVSGVSLDEEMTEMVKYQRAFEASARLISVVDELLETLVNIGR